MGVQNLALDNVVEPNRKFSTFSEPEHLKNPRFDWKQTIRRRLPVIGFVSNYRLDFLFQDILAGITVGMTEIPQGIAYAAVAGLEPQYGLYSGIMGPFVYAFLGSCKDVTIGPTAILALMVQSYVSDYGDDMAVLITFLAGCIVFVLGLLHLGFLVEFFSYPVIAGFTSAAALTIAASQFKTILGIPGKANEFLDAVISVFENIGETQMWDAILGFSTFAALLLMRQLRKYGSLKSKPEWSTRRNIVGRILMYLCLASNALAVAFGTLLAYLLVDENGDAPFVLTGDVGEGIPSLQSPPFSTTHGNETLEFLDMVEIYGSSIVFIPLIALLESVAIAKAFSKGKTVDATQEMLSLGMSNILGSCCRSMPVTGSFTRTAVNNASGVCTPLSGLVSGGMVLLALAFLTDTFYYIPKATLAAVVICAMVFLFEYESFFLLWKSKKLDLIPLVVTLIACLFLGLEYGILVGLATNITFVLYSSARPSVTIERYKMSCGDTFVVAPSKGLQYPAAEFIREMIIKHCDRPNSTVVIDGTYIRGVDATVAKNLKVLAEEILVRNQKVIFWNFKKGVREIIVGVEGKLEAHFRDGSLEEVCRDDHYPRLSYINKK